ncbi:MAG: sodium:calcium antiporter [Pikeienuella sp.]
MTAELWFSLAALPAALALLILASDYFLTGAIGLAGRLDLPEFVVGSIIVAVGTSAPELAINIAAGLTGQGDIVISNLVGSNIVNICLGIGLAGLFVRYAAIGANYGRALLVGLAAAVGLAALTLITSAGGQSVVPRWAGIVLTILFAVYVWQSFRAGGEEGDADGEISAGAKSLPVCIALVLGGAVAMAFLADLAVDSAVDISTFLGIPEAVIGATVIAAGGSLPEIFSCIAAARQGRPNIVLGNIAGSQLFNLLGILGITALIAEVQFSSHLAIDMGVLIVGTVLLLAFAAAPAGRKLLPAALLSVYGLYGGYLVYVSV